MDLFPGQILSTYEILAPLGAGAMGEVYRARDRKLGREVAIKVLPEQFAGDEERPRRFEREARMLASLNHPCVAQIFAVDKVGDTRFLVLELVPGETLEERLERGALPIDEVLEVCRQIAEGLEAAHEVGVIHRDLKPANVRITPDGKVKVLDFGLAKPARESGDASTSKDSVLSTEEGRLLGTPTYMAPEQARGKPIDKRVDVWAFGCVLYECLTERLAFDGETMSDVLAAVLEREPDWTRLSAATPRRVVELLHRCFAKDPRQRLRDIGEARLCLARAPAQEGVRAGAPEAARRSPGALTGLGVVAALLGAVLTYVLVKPAPAGAPLVRRFELTGVRSTDVSVLAISPDGQWLAWSMPSMTTRQLLLRRLDGSGSRSIDGTEGGFAPFFSPDSRSLAFFVDRRLCRVGLEPGSVVETVTSCAGVGHGTWGPDGTIVFSHGKRDTALWPGLMRVPASGGTPVVLTTPDAAKGERSHERPSFLPDGTGVLFTGEYADAFRCEWVSLATGERRVLVESATSPRYVPSGHLVWGNWDRKELLVAPFDPVALRMTGPAVVAVSGVAPLGRGSLGFDVANDGTLVYDPSELSDTETVLVWLDRTGARTDIDPIPSTWTQPRLSPDGKRLLLRKVGSPACTLWIRDLERGVLTRVDAQGDCHDPLWSFDGTRILYDSAGEAVQGVFLCTPDGGSPPELVAAASEHHLVSFSMAPDGKTLALGSAEDASTAPDIDLLEIGGARRGFLRSKYAESALSFAPDGGTIAYVSDETGSDEVYVRAFPGPGEVLRVSTAGGTDPLWSRDGRELFFTLESRMFAVPVTTGPLRVGRPELLFDTGASSGLDSAYAVSPDGQRFVVALSTRMSAELSFVRVVVNWFEELRQLAPEASRR
jgi:Tol biopolymer transport system component